MRALRLFLFAGLLTAAGIAQPSGSAPAFVAADVHVSPKTLAPRMTGGLLRGNRFEVRQATIVDLVRIAYSIDPDKILGGPSWVDYDRFDVFAKAPASATPDTARLMLRTLLADRFKLVAHSESKPMPAFVLSAGKAAAKLKAASKSAEPECRPQPRSAPLKAGEPPYIYYSCRNVTMVQFVEQLHSYANGYLGSPAFDQTGIHGSWDLDLHWSAVGNLAAAGAEGITLFDAVDKQLGLKLEPKPVPQPAIQIVSVNRTPTANAPGISAALPPPPPAEFKISDIKPAAPGANGSRLLLGANGRVDGLNMPLKAYINLAWSIDSDELLAGLPKFAETARYDITARVSATAGPGTGPQFDQESLRVMLQNLLKNRLRMKVHLENRPVNGYVLTSVKPKLARADPSGRTGCSQPPLGTANLAAGTANLKDPRLGNPALSRYVVCRNVTMAQFADLLPGFGAPYVTTSVLDSTGLKDAYDLSLSFSPDASDSHGALSLPDAVARQLGLKMELQKRPMEVLVIDHMDEKPADN